MDLSSTLHNQILLHGFSLPSHSNLNYDLGEGSQGLRAAFGREWKIGRRRRAFVLGSLTCVLQLHCSNILVVLTEQLDMLRPAADVIISL
uniref:Uncharacterized protein n=1 Tax=Arundo donax TaxID=35708 RepID=A0A0A9CUS7_ARUDO